MVDGGQGVYGVFVDDDVCIIVQWQFVVGCCGVCRQVYNG